MGAATAGSGVEIVTTGAYTGTNGVLHLTADSATTGVIVDLNAAALTTGKLIDASNLDALTTGYGLYMVSNSADTSARSLLYVKNDNSAAVGAYTLELANDALVSTNFKRGLKVNGVTIWTSNGTSPNGSLSGTAGDICLAADSGQSYRCTGTTSWTAQ